MNVIVFWETTILNENSLDVITFLLARVFHYYGLALQRERDRKSVCVCGVCVREREREGGEK